MDRMLKYFSYSHLRGELQEVSKIFAIAAENICSALPPSAERTTALRKLLEAKDAAVRAKVYPEET